MAMSNRKIACVCLATLFCINHVFAADSGSVNIEMRGLRTADAPQASRIDRAGGTLKTAAVRADQYLDWCECCPKNFLRFLCSVGWAWMCIGAPIYGIFLAVNWHDWSDDLVCYYITSSGSEGQTRNVYIDCDDIDNPEYEDIQIRESNRAEGGMWILIILWVIPWAIFLCCWGWCFRFNNCLLREMKYNEGNGDILAPRFIPARN